MLNRSIEFASKPAQRISVAVLLGLLMSAVCIYLMQMMVTQPSSIASQDYDYDVIDFVRVKRDTDTEVRNRLFPEQPNPVPQPKKKPLESLRSIDESQQQFEFDLPKAEILNALGDGPKLGGLDLGGINTASPQPSLSVSTPLVRIQPQYPRRAALKGIEGEVVVGFTVTAAGLVADVVVVSAKPRGVFEREAMRAISKWKFRPRLENGEAVAYKSQQKLVFQLDKS